MVNSQVIKEIREALKIDTSIEGTPTALPVIEVGLKHSKNISLITNECSAATSVTLITTPDANDFYIKGFTIAHTRDATATALYYGITVVIDGQTVFLCKIPTKTLVVGQETTFVSFDNPIKIDKASIVAIVNSTNVAISKTIVTLFYFIDEIN